jgi:solute carrier family 25 carnitine/acylcarnitine transporter 20/29
MFRIIAIEIPGGGAYFGTYYYLVNSLRPAGSERGQLSIPRTLFAGGMAGIMNWIVMLPPDVAKSRYQTAPAGQYKGIFSVYAELIREGGIRSLYKGFTPVFLRAFPANAGCFLGFELAIKVLNWAFPE